MKYLLCFCCMYNGMLSFFQYKDDLLRCPHCCCSIEPEAMYALLGIAFIRRET